VLGLGTIAGAGEGDRYILLGGGGGEVRKRGTTFSFPATSFGKPAGWSGKGGEERGVQKFPLVDSS